MIPVCSHAVSLQGRQFKIYEGSAVLMIINIIRRARRENNNNPEPKIGSFSVFPGLLK